jgi:hypothetical protein
VATKKSVGVFFFVSLLTTMLSATVMFMAPLPARFLRLNFGRVAYWLFTVASSSVIAAWSLPWALSQFILLLAVGLFTDLEEMKVPLFYSALSSVFISGLSFILLITVWAKSQKTDLASVLKARINEALVLTQKMQSVDLPLDVPQVLALFPALVAICLMLIIFMSVMFVKGGAREEKLTAFKVPEAVIWVFIGALAGTFLVDVTKYFWIQKVFCNTLYVVSALYYFQGLAVVAFVLQRMKVNYFLKAAMFFLLTFHLFIFVAAFGLSDVWFGYRSRLYRKVVKTNINNP